MTFVSNQTGHNTAVHALSKPDRKLPACQLVTA